MSAGMSRYMTELPFEVAARTALSVFGVVSAIDARAVNWSAVCSNKPQFLQTTTMRKPACMRQAATATMTRAIAKICPALQPTG